MSIIDPPLDLSPAFFIKQELEARGWTQRDLAYILGCHEQIVNLLVSRKRGISADMSKALGAAFDVAPDFFSNLQRSYDLSRARDPDPAVFLRARLQSSYPVREMIRRGWLDDSDHANLERQMADFFEVRRIDEIPRLPHAGRKTHYDEVPAAQLAWLFRVRQIARSVVVPEYRQEHLEGCLKYLKTFLDSPEKASEVPSLLSKCGVRMVVAESLPQGKIDGACFWLDSSSPVIGLSLRFDRIDNFWFVLRHEIEHVLRRDGEANSVEIIDELDGRRSAVDNDDLPTEEIIANKAAANFCVPENLMTRFIVQRGRYISERDVLLFARSLNIHPGLVVGQIHSRTGRYELLRRHLVKVRQFVLANAVVDGWGHVFPVAG
jgi:HTH-type transcriptional regulator / antitoxin HigA